MIAESTNFKWWHRRNQGNASDARWDDLVRQANALNLILKVALRECLPSLYSDALYEYKLVARTLYCVDAEACHTYLSHAELEYASFGVKLFELDSVVNPNDQIAERITQMVIDLTRAKDLIDIWEYVVKEKNT